MVKGSEPGYKHRLDVAYCYILYIYKTKNRQTLNTKKMPLKVYFHYFFLCVHLSCMFGRLWIYTVNPIHLLNINHICVNRPSMYIKWGSILLLYYMDFETLPHFFYSPNLYHFFSPYPPLPSPPLLHSRSSHRGHLSSPDHHFSPTGHALHPSLQYHPPSRNRCHLFMETRWCLARYQRGSSALCYQHFGRHHDWQCPGAWCRKIHMYSSNQGSIYRWQSDLPPRCLLQLQCHCHKWGAYSYSLVTVKHWGKMFNVKYNYIFFIHYF